MPKIYSLFFYVLAAPAFAQIGAYECGEIKNAFGPFDYRVERGNNLYLVEMAHFTAPVESLIKGNAGYLGGDLDYTLRAFPNHHRALIAMMRYGEKTKSAKPPNTRYSVECYFDRAIRFQPNDSITRMIYSMYLVKAGRRNDAISQLDIAATYAGETDNAFTHYNLGLNYLDNKEYEKSLAQAHKAYDLGFTQPVLRDRLKEAGKWTEPVPASPDTPASATTPP